MFLEHDLAEPDLFTPNSFSTEQIEKYLNEALESKTCKVFVATKDGEIVGTIRATIKEAPSFYKDKWIGYTDDLVVKEEYRRKGIGGQLISKSIEYYKSKDISIVESKIYEFNKPSQALSEKLGFKKTFSYFYKRI
jgi:ribosomal protein S18 acetylase RimI-like enzyme